MSGDGKRILESALTLPPVERAELVEELLSSFDFPARADVDALWAREAESRIDAYEKGELIARLPRRMSCPSAPSASARKHPLRRQ
jgi:putative addiction module component (TIGR02574 family)